MFAFPGRLIIECTQLCAGHFLPESEPFVTAERSQLDVPITVNHLWTSPNDSHQKLQFVSYFELLAAKLLAAKLLAKLMSALRLNLRFLKFGLHKESVVWTSYCE